MNEQDEKDFEAWARRATKGVRESSVFVQIFSRKFVDDPLSEPQAIMQLGLAVMLNKPIIVMCEPGDSLPPPLARLARKVVHGLRSDPEQACKRLAAAIREVAK